MLSEYVKLTWKFQNPRDGLWFLAVLVEVGSAGKRSSHRPAAPFITSDQSTARVHRYMTARLSIQVWSSNGAVQLCLPQLRGNR